jgi:hypothetical protein
VCGVANHSAAGMLIEIGPLNPRDFDNRVIDNAPQRVTTLSHRSILQRAKRVRRSFGSRGRKGVRI